MRSMKVPSLHGDNQFGQMCHDLRQYVAAGLLLTEVPEPEGLSEEVADRLETLRGLLEQADAMLDRAQADFDLIRVEPAREPVDLVALANECADLVRLTRQVSLTTQATEPVVVLTDPVMLRRAVANVLDSTARATGSGGQISVRVCHRPPYACVEIEPQRDGSGNQPLLTGHGLSAIDVALRECSGHLEIHSARTHGTTVRLLVPGQPPTLPQQRQAGPG